MKRFSAKLFNRNYKKILEIFFLSLIILFFVNVSVYAKAQWSLLVYFSGSESSIESYGLNFINSLKNNYPNVKVLILFRGITLHPKVALYEITSQGKSKLDLPTGITIDSPMNEADTLKKFVEWVQNPVNGFDASNYMLILGGHGGGWSNVIEDTQARYPAEWLNYYRDKTNIFSIRKALDGKKFSIIGLDACYQSSLEIACQFKENITTSGTYMIAPEEVSKYPAKQTDRGLWLYDKLIETLNNNNEPLDVAKNLPNFTNQQEDVPLVAIDLSKIEAVKTSTNALAKELNSKFPYFYLSEDSTVKNLTPNPIPTVTIKGPTFQKYLTENSIAAARRLSWQAFYGEMSITDIKNFAENIIKVNNTENAKFHFSTPLLSPIKDSVNGLAQKVIDSVNDAIISFSPAITGNMYGLNIYHPYFGSQISPLYENLLFAIDDQNIESEWYKYLTNRVGRCSEAFFYKPAQSPAIVQDSFSEGSEAVCSFKIKDIGWMAWDSLHNFFGQGIKGAEKLKILTKAQFEAGEEGAYIEVRNDSDIELHRSPYVGEAEGEYPLYEISAKNTEQEVNADGTVTCKIKIPYVWLSWEVIHYENVG